MVMIIRFYLLLVLTKSRIIKNTSKKLGVKISRIGKIRPNNQKSLLIGEKGQHLLIKNTGYKHQF
jgi:thiamine-monophosphate kinase